MSDTPRASARLVQDNLLEHPAVVAWSQLQPERVQPDRIEILKEKTGARVYRLCGVGLGGGSVVAKQRRLAPDGSLVERTAFGHVFPQLSLPSLHYYGFVADPEPGFGWLFLEDAGYTQYQAYRDDHRALGGRLLAALHQFGRRATTAESLPRRERSWHLDSVRSVRRDLDVAFGNAVLTPADHETLRRLLGLVDVLESEWSRVAAIIDPLPQTIVIGNFVPRNSHVRGDGADAQLLIVDCESLAWDTCVCDLAQTHDPKYGDGFSGNPDLRAYVEASAGHWPELDLAYARELANCGTVLRALAALSWDAPFLHTDWAMYPMAKMRAYEFILLDAMRVAGWTA